MKKKTIVLFSIAGIWAATGFAQTVKDSARIAKNLTIDEVVQWEEMNKVYPKSVCWGWIY